MKFYLGSHQPGWLARISVPLFISDVRLREYKTLPRAAGRWALDSGGFSQIAKYGTWSTGPTPRQYADRVRRYAEEIGNLDWAAPQDWMCEPDMIAKTGLSVAEHQRRTVDNFAQLREIAPDLPFAPVLQGFELTDYLRCIELYADAGVDLAAAPIVGVGSVCRRQGTRDADAIMSAVTTAVPGIRVHGFGVKTTGLGQYGELLTSADSLAWSYAARRSAPLPECRGRHATCSNCPTYALRWRTEMLAGTRTAPADLQLSLF